LLKTLAPLSSEVFGSGTQMPVLARSA